MVSSSDFQKAVELIDKSSNCLITAHIRPDGDGCGSIGSMAEWLEATGKQVQPLLLSPLADWYEFLFEEKVPVLGNDVSLEELKSGQFGTFDLVIIVDTNSSVQLRGIDEWLKQAKIPILVIDHHITNDGLGDVELIDTAAAATGEIVLELLKHAGQSISTTMAQSLFVAIATDTGWFRFANADSRAYHCGAELIEAGADCAGIYRKMYQNFSPQRMKLLSRMLDSLELHFDNRAATQYIMRSDFDAVGATGKDTENLIDECQRIASVQAAAMFVELKDGGFRCSLRSKDGVDVRQIAQKFGGGGHTMASGVNLEGPLEKAKSLILAEIEKQL